ncbi:MAG: RAD55 family ATPase [Haloferacaceae archaeon]
MADGRTVGGRRLSTGVATLDDHLDGGVPVGSLVAFKSPSSMQSELLLYTIAAQRRTVYVSTTRNDQLVRGTLDAVSVDVGDVQVTYAPPDTALEIASDAALDAPEGANVIVDTADILEGYERHEYQRFLNRLLIHLRNSGSIAVFHCHEDDDEPAHRGLTEAMAEIVLELHAEIDGASRETYLAVPKFRSGRALTDLIKIELTDEITVDTSRNIA